MSAHHSARMTTATATWTAWSHTHGSHPPHRTHAAHTASHARSHARHIRPCRTHWRWTESGTIVSKVLIIGDIVVARDEVCPVHVVVISVVSAMLTLSLWRRHHRGGVARGWYRHRWGH